MGSITAITITNTILAIKTNIRGSSRANNVEMSVLTSRSCILDARSNMRSSSPEASPLLIIDGDKYDFMESKEDRVQVLETVENKLLELGNISEEQFEHLRKSLIYF